MHPAAARRHRLLTPAAVLVALGLGACFAPPAATRAGYSGQPSGVGAGAGGGARPTGQMALMRLSQLTASAGGIAAEEAPERWAARLAPLDAEVAQIVARERAGYVQLQREWDAPANQALLAQQRERLQRHPLADGEDAADRASRMKDLERPYRGQEAMLEIAAGQFWHASRRPGQAVDGLRRAYALMSDRDALAMRLLCLVSLSVTESALGRFATGDELARQARVLARAVLAGKAGDALRARKPEARERALAAERGQAVAVLATDAARLGELGDTGAAAAEVRALWPECRTALATGIAPEQKASSAWQLAQALAMVGDAAAAAEALGVGEAAAKALKAQSAPDRRRHELERLAARAHVALAQAAYPEAVALFAELEAAAPAPQAAPAGLWHGVALARAGQRDAAITVLRREVAALEAQRAGVDLGERATLLRPARSARAYGELMRALLPADAAGALAVSEQRRARQLRELLAATGKAPPVADAAALRAALAEGEVALSLHLDGGALTWFVLTRDALEAGTAPTGAGLDAELARWRTLLADPASDVAAIDALAATLGQRLLAPVAARLPAAKRLLLVPDGRLASVPPGLLRLSDGRRLGAAVEVVQLPALAFIARRPTASRTQRLVALGDAVYGTARPLGGHDADGTAQLIREVPAASFTALPETRSEVAAIAALYAPEAQALLGAEASAQRLRALPLRGVTTLHIACHGVIGGDVAGIDEPALVLSCAGGDDGLLRARDVAALDLDSGLVVLSACSTGAGELIAGEGAMGMGRAFLAAGAEALVVSLWPVDSLATERLMVALHRRVRAGETPAAALAAAQAMVATGAPDDGAPAASVERGMKPAQAPVARDHAHPYFWSAFVVVGR